MLEKEKDPSILTAPYAGKLTRYLVEDGAHLRRGEPFAEVEVIRCSYILHLTSYILHLTSYILHLTSYIAEVEVIRCSSSTLPVPPTAGTTP